MADLDIENACSTSANKPIGTTALDAASCNLSSLDRAVNSSESTWTSRTGIVRDTIQGALNKLGVLYDDPIRDWAPLLVVSDLRAHRYPASTGDIYIPVAPLPFTTGASFNTDNWVLLSGITSQDLIDDLSQAYEFPTVAAYRAFSFEFPVGKRIYLADRDSYFSVIAGKGTANTFNIIASVPVDQSITLINDETTTIDSYGAVGGTDESPIFQLYSDWATSQTGITTMKLGRNKTYMCTNVVITSNTHLDLNGSTVLQVPDASTSVFRNISTTDVQTESNIYITNGIIDGNSQNYTQDRQNFLVSIVSVHHFVFYDVTFQNLRSINVGGGTSIALRISGTSSFYSIDRCRFYRCGTASANGNGIFAQGSYATISNCIADMVYDAPFNFERMTNGVMTNNVATNSGVAFAVTLQSENITLSNNVSVNSSTSCFLVDKFVSAGGTLMKNINLTGNFSKNSGTGGVGNNYRIVDAEQVTLSGNSGDTANDASFELQGCTNVSIDGGIATNSTTKYGVLAQNSSDIRIADLDIFNHSSYGIFLNTCFECLVTSNKIHDTNEHQIRVSAGEHNTIEGNEIYDQRTAGQRAVFTDNSTDHCSVIGNNIYDTRATPIQRGVSFHPTSTNCFYKGNTLYNLVTGNWLNDSGINTKGYVKIGATAQRPTGLGDGGDDIGLLYLDTTLAPGGRPIWWNGTGWSDSAGNAV